MSWNVLVTARTFAQVGASSLEMLRNAGCHIVMPEKAGPYPAAELLNHVRGKEIDAVLASPDQYSSEVLASPEFSRLKIVSRWGVGFDSIDVQAATTNGIVVAYTPGFLNETVADYTFGLLLSIARQIHVSAQSMKEGKWANNWGRDVFGKTLGIIGCGRIGQAVARRASGFSMRVLGSDLQPPAGCPNITFVSLEELLADSDFVCLHAAYTPESRDMLNESRLRQMKKGAYIINTARGPLINEAALIRALTEGWIAGAALDVFNTEPMAPDHPFRTTPNLLLSPHQSSFARETGERVSEAATQAVLDLMRGKRPRNVVDPLVFDSPQLRARLA